MIATDGEQASIVAIDEEETEEEDISTTTTEEEEASMIAMNQEETSRIEMSQGEIITTVLSPKEFIMIMRMERKFVTFTMGRRVTTIMMISHKSFKKKLEMMKKPLLSRELYIFRRLMNMTLSYTVMAMLILTFARGFLLGMVVVMRAKEVESEMMNMTVSIDEYSLQPLRKYDGEKLSDATMGVYEMSENEG